MKRGVFLLVLDFVEDKKEIKIQKKGFRKKRHTRNENELKRYSLNINGRNVIVLELTEGDLHNEDVLKLLRIYKGRVLTSIEKQINSILKEYTFNPKEYYQRALLSSLINQMKSVNKGWRTVSLKLEEFYPHKELYELVKISKRVNIITIENALTDKFAKECYYEYGAIITFRECDSFKYDVYLNLDEIDSNGRLMINAGGRDCLLYSDMKYFEDCTEYQKLNQFNIDHNIICSAFSDQ